MCREGNRGVDAYRASHIFTDGNVVKLEQLAREDLMACNMCKTGLLLIYFFSC